MKPRELLCNDGLRVAEMQYRLIEISAWYSVLKVVNQLINQILHDRCPIEGVELRSNATFKTICHLDSKIQIQASPTRLEIEVPREQAKISFQTDLALVNH